MSGTEIVFLFGLAIVVVGPKRLPAMMRTAGQWVAKIRRMTSDVRQNTGIDKIIRDEGLEKEIRELSSLTRSPMFRTMMNLSPGALITNALAQTTASSTAPAGVTSPLARALAVPSSAGSQGNLSQSNASSTTPSTGGGLSSTNQAPSAAASLIKPAEGNVPRGSDQAFAALKSAGFFSFREREYPTIGCDAYEALPDDLDDPDAYPDEMPEAAAEALADGSAVAGETADVDEKLPAAAPPDVDGEPKGDATMNDAKAEASSREPAVTELAAVVAVEVVVEKKIDETTSADASSALADEPNEKVEAAP